MRERGRGAVPFMSYKDPFEASVGCPGGPSLDTRHLRRGPESDRGERLEVGSNLGVPDLSSWKPSSLICPAEFIGQYLHTNGRVTTEFTR